MKYYIETKNQSREVSELQAVKAIMTTRRMGEKDARESLERLENAALESTRGHASYHFIRRALRVVK